MARFLSGAMYRPVYSGVYLPGLVLTRRVPRMLAPRRESQGSLEGELGMNRPWKVLGIGWLFAIIVAVITVLALLHLIAASETIVLVCLLLLALALLL
jgi:undecaprenyl pyrophosphate phosphatase UppP